MRILLLLTFSAYLIYGGEAGAQPAAPERDRVLALGDFYGLILSNHPLARQASNLPEMARREIRTARGAFDPVLKSDYDEKRFDEKNYWSIWQSKLQVPVWFGTDLKIAYDNNNGNFLDDNLKVPEGGLSYVGLTLPLGQGLLIDQRRATLRQAQLGASMAEAERVKVINKLLLQAAKDYWDWAFTWNRYLLHVESLRLAEVRFEAIRERVLFGDLPAIDSLEAFIEVQNRENIRSQSLMEFNNARLIAETYLWNNLNEPVQLDSSVVPVVDVSDVDTISAIQLNVLREFARMNHPELVKIGVKIDQLQIERRWATEKLRPKLNVDYNFLRAGSEPWQNIDQGWTMNNNYKLGVNFSVPLFLREERGKLGLTKLKIQQTTFEQQQLRRDIEIQVQTSWNELLAMREQINVQAQQVVNAGRMLDGEQFRFSAGESSIFLINARENALINSRIKLVELRTKYAKSKAFLYWSAGSLSR